MKIKLIVMGIAVLMGACDGDGDRSDSSETHDSTLSNAADHNGEDSGMNHDGSMSGDMTQNMSRMNSMMVSMLGAADSTYEMRFIDLMVPHHQSALMMAEDALTKAQHPELKSMAQMMIDAQRKEISQLKSWRQQWYGDSAVAPMMMEGTDMESMGRMMVEHLGSADSTYDDRFIDMMIPHHDGAVMMAEDALKKARKPELKTMAQKIIDDQNKEIAQMKQWRTQWFGH